MAIQQGKNDQKLSDFLNTYRRNIMPNVSILDRIVRIKRQEVKLLQVEVPLVELLNDISRNVSPTRFSHAIVGESPRLIAEIKRASPSKGLMNSSLDPQSMANLYADNGAAAISVLTERRHFKGSLDDLSVVKEVVQPRGLPVLRKDFIFTEYQVYESRAAGADAILLIVSILARSKLKALLNLAHSLDMQCLVEVHKLDELERAVECGAEIIGINNRDLHTFVTDISLTETLSAKVPNEIIIVSESGIRGRDDVSRLHQAGVSAILVGESIVVADDPAAKIRELAGY